MIVEVRVLTDFIAWFEQIWVNFLAGPLGVAHVSPAPTDYDGFFIDPRDPAEKQKTLSLRLDFLYLALDKC